MSKLDNTNQSWGNAGGENLDSKYEKCRNITEEIYKRINITFEIKKLETETQTDLSDNSEIDSNELSNETDLFACDKTSISSSTDADKPKLSFEKFINNNNNEESLKKATALYKRPKKRFRKRQKKRINKNVSDSDVSSDEALPLCRTLELEAKRDDVSCSNGSLDSVMGVPRVVIGTKGKSPPTCQSKAVKNTDTVQTPPKDTKPTIPSIAVIKIDMRNASSPKIVGKDVKDRKNCNICNLSFRGDRGLRRHMTMSHIIVNEQNDTTKHGVRSA